MFEDVPTVVPCALWYIDANIMFNIFIELMWICIKELMNSHGIQNKIKRNKRIRVKNEEWGMN